MNEIKKIINQNETIIWEGKPQVGPFTFSSILLIPFGIVFTIFALVFLEAPSNLPTPLFIKIFPMIFVVIGLLITLNPIYNYILSKKTFYAVTDKRVIIQKGIIGTDFEAIDYDQIKSMEVSVGVIDKIFGENSGTISIDSGKVGSTSKGGIYSIPHLLQSISDPYVVFEKLKKVSHDIKTDIEYPNDLRPKNNPGYNTKY